MTVPELLISRPKRKTSQAQLDCCKRRRLCLLEQGLCITCGKKPNQGETSQHCPECQQRQRESQRRTHERKKALNICRGCPNQALPGKAHCSKCTPRIRVRSKINSRRRVRQFRELGLCTQCGRERDVPNNLRCRACNDKQREYGKKNYQRIRQQLQENRWQRLAQGICTHCGKCPAANGIATCDKCRHRIQNYHKKLIQKRNKEGLCIRCSSPDLVTTTRCEVCRQYVNEKQRRRVARLDAAGICYKCGHRPYSPLGGKECDVCRRKIRKNPERRNHPRQPRDPNMPKQPRGRPCNISTAGQRLWDVIRQLPWWCGSGIGKEDGNDVIVLCVDIGTTQQAREWWDASTGPWKRWGVKIIESGKFRAL